MGTHSVWSKSGSSQRNLPLDKQRLKDEGGRTPRKLFYVSLYMVLERKIIFVVWARASLYFFFISEANPPPRDGTWHKKIPEGALWIRIFSYYRFCEKACDIFSLSSNVICKIIINSFMTYNTVGCFFFFFLHENRFLFNIAYIILVFRQECKSSFR